MEPVKQSLLLGCGNRTSRDLDINGTWGELTRLDISEACHPDIVWDLNNLPLPFKDSQFDEIHAYSILEHISSQGDYNHFFEEFNEYWRILKPEGKFFAICPRWDQIWAFSDPGHTRIISEAILTFLCQSEYEIQIGKTSMTDYREIYKADFEVLHFEYLNEFDWGFILKAIK